MGYFASLPCHAAGLPLANKDLVPNLNLRKLIQARYLYISLGPASLDWQARGYRNNLRGRHEDTTNSSRRFPGAAVSSFKSDSLQLPWDIEILL